MWVNNVMAGNLSVKKEFALRITGFDENFWESRTDLKPSSQDVSQNMVERFDFIPKRPFDISVPLGAELDQREAT